jgi:two-component system chemotaxis response regulator CheY
MMQQLRALVVDDSPTMRRSLVYALQRLEGSGTISCVEAENGAEALGQLQQGPFDLVLTDINMPVMDGLKLISAIREQPAWRSLPIVVISTSLEDKISALSLGANAYLTKPIQSRAVLTAVSGLLKNR